MIDAACADVARFCRKASIGDGHRGRRAIDESTLMSYHVRLVRPTETTICSDDDELRHARSVNAILPGR
jgi:hypothetical protein